MNKFNKKETGRNFDFKLYKKPKLTRFSKVKRIRAFDQYIPNEDGGSVY
ncbi:MAG TPA: hypothetical protein PLC32_05560 [Candidatus Omnitrophota bacterium]|nr:hypothetical protein [Candidatus Omnitrophota bacterium]